MVATLLQIYYGNIKLRKHEAAWKKERGREKRKDVKKNNPKLAS
jgi:hypothetical protein